MKTTLLITLFLSPIYLIFWIVRKLDNLETDKWRQEQLEKSFNRAKGEGISSQSGRGQRISCRQA